MMEMKLLSVYAQTLDCCTECGKPHTNSPMKWNKYDYDPIITLEIFNYPASSLNTSCSSPRRSAIIQIHDHFKHLAHSKSAIPNSISHVQTYFKS